MYEQIPIIILASLQMKLQNLQKKLNLEFLFSWVIFFKKPMDLRVLMVLGLCICQNLQETTF